MRTSSKNDPLRRSVWYDIALFMPFGMAMFAIFTAPSVRPGSVIAVSLIQLVMMGLYTVGLVYGFRRHETTQGHLAWFVLAPIVSTSVSTMFCWSMGLAYGWMQPLPIGLHASYSVSIVSLAVLLMTARLYPSWHIKTVFAASRG